MTVCGTCEYYDEWKNGYCPCKQTQVEPEDNSCDKYKESEERDVVN